jgi:hypothetical protein
MPTSFLREDGLLALLSAADYDTIPHPNLRAWCHLHARYGLPTKELVEWLRKGIGDRKAIEIGAGAGDLAHHLGIPATDNRMQEWPHIKEWYTLKLQPTIAYPDWVEALDAVDAVEKYQPQVVIASWVTEWVDPNLPCPASGGNMFGVHEDQVLDTGVTYILVGNQEVHGSKQIMERPHYELTLPFLRSRAIDPSLNRVYVWPGSR